MKNESIAALQRLGFTLLLVLALTVFAGCDGDESSALLPDTTPSQDVHGPGGEDSAQPEDATVPREDTAPPDDRDATVPRDAAREASSGGDDRDDVVGPRYSAHGRVADMAGVAIAGVKLILCYDGGCSAGDSDGQGNFRFQNVEIRPIALKYLGKLQGFFSVSVPAPTGEGLDFDFGEVRLPRLPADGTLVRATESATVAVLPELTLHLPAGLEFPAFFDEELVRGVRLDESDWPALLVGLFGGRQALMVVALDPFGTYAPSPIGFEVTLSEAVGPVVVYGIDQETAALVEAGRFDGSGGATIVSGPGEGLHELTWLIVLPQE